MNKIVALLLQLSQLPVCRWAFVLKKMRGECLFTDLWFAFLHAEDLHNSLMIRHGNLQKPPAALGSHHTAGVCFSICVSVFECILRHKQRSMAKRLQFLGTK